MYILTLPITLPSTIWMEVFLLTFADGGSTLVQVQGMDSDYAVSQLAEASR